MRSLLVLIAGAIGLSSTYAQDVHEIRDSFIFSLREQLDGDFNFWFLRAGLQSADAIRFDDGYRNLYYRFSNTLVLTDRLTENGIFKDLQDIDRIHLGTLAHESWHAFFANFIERNEAYQKKEDWFEARAKYLFPDLKQSNAEEALEEAYAQFIGQVIIDARFLHHTTEAYLRRDNFDCDQAHGMFDRIWSASWRNPIFGYYHRNSIKEYWSDRFRIIYVGITGDRSASPPAEGLNYVETSINDVDRDWISENLFEGRWTEFVEDSFPHLYERLGCDDLSY